MDYNVRQLNVGMQIRWYAGYVITQSSEYLRSVTRRQLRLKTHFFGSKLDVHDLNQILMKLNFLSIISVFFQLSREREHPLVGLLCLDGVHFMQGLEFRRQFIHVFWRSTQVLKNPYVSFHHPCSEAHGSVNDITLNLSVTGAPAISIPVSNITRKRRTQ